MLQLKEKWGPRLTSQPETGMGYQVTTIFLRDGRRFEQVMIVEGLITRIRGRSDIPFNEEDIEDIVVTHDKWKIATDR